jgi:hypothetical protein
MSPMGPEADLARMQAYELKLPYPAMEHHGRTCLSTDITVEHITFGLGEVTHLLPISVLAPVRAYRAEDVVWRAAEQPICSSCDKKLLQRLSPVHAGTYALKNIAGQVPPFVRERLPGSALEPA